MRSRARRARFVAMSNAPGPSEPATPSTAQRRKPGLRAKLLLTLFALTFALLALEGITTPANVGMAIRSAAAGGLDGVLLPERGTSGLNPLVIKASAGAVFHTRILRCRELLPALQSLQALRVRICSLEGEARASLFEHTPGPREVFVLGSESDGISSEVRALADCRLSIPLKNGVESLNVAVAASLVAYAGLLRRG